jgi:hypothetical protein
MSQAPLAPRARRDELLARCRRERYELVASSATTLTLIPRARRVAHWIRATSRMLRVISASMRAG